MKSHDNYSKKKCKQRPNCHQIVNSINDHISQIGSQLNFSKQSLQWQVI